MFAGYVQLDIVFIFMHRIRRFGESHRTMEFRNLNKRGRGRRSMVGPKQLKKDIIYVSYTDAALVTRTV